MQRCLDLARRGAGRVSPNPMVGAVLIGPEGSVLGEGWHRAYGGPHAEVDAIEAAEAAHGADALRRARLYVNLEPCSHHGQTPPCADLVVRKEIPQVVVGMTDPSPKVAGRGLRRLREAGVEVTTGVLEKPCKRLNEAFTRHVRTGCPLVTLKVAQTLTGQVATSGGDARWISGTAARRRVHRWRSEIDGVLVGSGTASADDPRLTVRHVEGRSPRRFVLDRTASLSPALNLFTDEAADRTTALVGAGRPAPAYAQALEEAGGQIVDFPETEGHLDLEALLDGLGAGRAGAPLQSLLVEAGPGLATALIRQGLIDRFFLFIAPKLVGSGVPALRALDIHEMKNAIDFAEHTWDPVGDDLLFQGYCHAV